MLVVGSQAIGLLMTSKTAIRAMRLSAWLLVMVRWAAVRPMNPATAYGAEFHPGHTYFLITRSISC
jgi:hypothetical protein